MLKPKAVSGRIQVLRVLPYKGCMVYIRRIDKEIFEWLLVYKDQIYSSYMIFTPAKGKKELSKRDILVASGLVWAGATTTIDIKMGVKLDDKKRKKAEMFLKATDTLN